ncbi:hypothetical protein F0562_010289 [Nyssa sinensis]|uniref:Tyrosinase copper-binding domain-containing protein n=1 Tax=Nyssa sinensis TaxID=561372 RepID=A0A5J5A1E3_9ASTE|nr:hypothetical protein F0562_010289 [Nyssa sinensis]
MIKETEKNPALFMGKPLVAGQAVPSNAPGSLENLHNAVHMWTGPSEGPYHDMGNFYTAARDVLFFFGHHANVDRMWDIYNGFRGHTPEFKQADRLEASFIFYDENRQVVRHLTESIQVLVQRPEISCSKYEKDEATEVLFIEGIEDNGELAGSFVKIPQTHHKFPIKNHKSSLELGITVLLEDIEAETFEKLVVTILPRIGEITVGGVHIELVKVDDESY